MFIVHRIVRLASDSKLALEAYPLVSARSLFFAIDVCLASVSIATFAGVLTRCY